jgi:hypothetical protein
MGTASSLVPHSGNRPSAAHRFQCTHLYLTAHRWRTYLRPDVKHPHLEPFTEWEAAVIVQAQREMGNNWLGKTCRPQSSSSSSSFNDLCPESAMTQTINAMPLAMNGSFFVLYNSRGGSTRQSEVRSTAADHSTKYVSTADAR